MDEPRVYVETTVPSLYHDLRSTPDIVARREWTRQWWGDAIRRYELVTSTAVLDELAGGPPEHSAPRLALVRDLPILPIEPAITEVVSVYIRHKVMPTDPGGDALHLKTKADPAIDEIREIRHWISERFDHDPERLVAYYMELQEKYRDRFVGALSPAEPRPDSDS